VNWLENPKDETERFLHASLESARNRTGDEISHRRVWAKIANIHDEAKPKRSWKFVWIGATACSLLVGGIVAYSQLRKAPSAVTTVVLDGQTPATLPPTAAPFPDLITPERLPGQSVHTGAEETIRVALGGGAEAQLFENSSVKWDQHRRPNVESGKARFQVPHQPPGWRFSVTSGPYLITVVGTKFDVDVKERSIQVSVTEGVVEVGHGQEATRLVAGDTWEGPRFTETTAPSATPSTPAGLKMKVSTPLENLPSARAALRDGNPEKAAEILARLAAGSGPTAENAAYELALITRDNLHRPQQAISLWGKYRRRFPSGVLRAESDLSIVETLSRIGENQAALSEATAFQARYPNSERKGEVGALIERLRVAERKERGE